jgi:hypothetical protein
MSRLFENIPWSGGSRSNPFFAHNRPRVDSGEIRNSMREVHSLKPLAVALPFLLQQRFNPLRLLEREQALRWQWFRADAAIPVSSAVNNRVATGTFSRTEGIHPTGKVAETRSGNDELRQFPSLNFANNCTHAL